MVRAPVGAFEMGEEGRPGVGASPAHTVSLSRTHFVSDREVTVGQFQRFLDDPSCPDSDKPPYWSGFDRNVSPTADCPMQQVNWFDAVLYCNWLSRQERRAICYQKTGKRFKYQDPGGTEFEVDVWTCDFEAAGYRLPTEAEWEHACRAGAASRWCFGDQEKLLGEYAVFAGNAMSRVWPAGGKLPNDWGLFDMHGSLWEWCWDGHRGYAAGETRDPTGPPGPSDARVVRGGSWWNDPAESRSAYRAAISPVRRESYRGFRVCAP